MGWLQGIIGLFSFFGELLGWVKQKKHDEIVVKAADADRAKGELAETKKGAADARKTEEDVARLPDDELDQRLRGFSRKPKP